MSATSAIESVRSCDAQSVMYKLVAIASISSVRQLRLPKLEVSRWLAKAIDDTKRDYQFGSIGSKQCACQPGETHGSITKKVN